MTEIFQLIATYGLPVVLTVWFVFRIDVVVTKMVGLLESFIIGQDKKEEDTAKKTEELVEAVKEAVELIREVKQDVAKIDSKIDILGVKLDR